MMLIALMLGLSGCRDDEVIEIISTEENTAERNDNESIEKTENIETNASQSFVVYVTGYVNNPGVYELREGSRVIDAIDAAGGYLKEASSNFLNLASYVSDGQMIYVPSEEEADMVKGEEQATMKVENSLVNINTAGKEELMTLPGIGEAKAEKIITYRENNGGFSSPEGIMEISGIKEGLYNKIKDRICVK